MVKRLKENEEEQLKALRALEQATTKMETEKIKQQAEAVRYRATVTGLLFGVFFTKSCKIERKVVSTTNQNEEISQGANENSKQKPANCPKLLPM